MRGFYLIGNYPDKDSFIGALRLIEKYGFDFVEIGIPFSDPVADGPFLAKRAQLAIERGVTLEGIIKTLGTLKLSLRVYLMTYANIILSRNVFNLNRTLKDIGIEGVIVADLPNRMHWFLRKMGLDVPIVHFATPESRFWELDELKRVERGFIYFISIRGITGSSMNLDEETKEKLNYLKGKTKVPVVLGFGVKKLDDAKVALALADGYVVGTEAVRRLEEGLDSFEGLLKELVDIENKNY
ncbi:MAG: tryptophan synthase subunit alpha [Thermosulfidibacteraceae bacterium]|jgi:tryptophan synthase alpha chain